ncbi:MAG: hypothetical protein AAGA30_18595 [Planctomycetota bacterium]
MTLKYFIAYSLALFLNPLIVAQSPLNLMTWNVESDGADPQVIAEQLKELSGFQIYALTEVDKRNFDLFESACGKNFKSIEGTHKENDHLQIIYDDSVLKLESWTEIEDYAGYAFNRPDRALRCPLLGRFVIRQSGKSFQVVVNHLARGNAKFRQQQAKGLREWGRNQTVPTISIGDFNFDFVFKTRQGNRAFQEFTQDNVWKWIEPEELIDSNWYDADRDGKDDYPGSILDFAFVTGPAKSWNWKCEVIQRPGDFPDDKTTSDHRPLKLQWIPNANANE